MGRSDSDNLPMKFNYYCGENGTTRLIHAMICMPETRISPF